jgi:hypothetical protein
VVVYDPDEHAAKGEGWEESPDFGDDDESEETKQSEAPKEKVKRQRKPKATENASS